MRNKAHESMLISALNRKTSCLAARGYIKNRLNTVSEDKKMETLMEAVALFGRPEYDEKTENGSLLETVLWAIKSINQ